MKSLRKIMALLIAMVMVLGMSVSVFAATPTAKITVPNVEGHTYEIFQIFTADVTDNGVVSNVKWGKNGKGTINTDVDQTTLNALANLVQSQDDATKLVEIEKYVNISDDDAFVKNVAAGTQKEVPTGYYLVKDQDNSVNGNDAYTTYIVEVVKDVVMRAKSDTVEVEKKVKDINDSTDAGAGDWTDSADYDIGDAIPYKLTGTLPENFADYKTYKTYTFTDTLSKGLFITDEQLGAVTVTIGENGTDIKSNFDVAFANNVLTVSLKTNADLKDITGINKDSKIVVGYYATLTESAVLGKDGNPNTVKLQYSNNPNYNGEGDEDTGNTPVDKVIVFTYKPIVNKVDGNGNALEGAGFTLYKQVAAGTDSAQAGSAIKAALAETNASIKADALEDTKYYIALTLDAEQNGTTFSYKGIDDGTYVLVETTIPAGYNAFEAKKFDVTATHTDGADPALTELSGGEVLTGSVDAGTLEGNIENNQGGTLPSTGGMGTTLFYIVGGILVAGAAIILIAKRKVNA